MWLQNRKKEIKMYDKHYYFNELTKHRFDFDVEKLNSWLTDYSAIFCAVGKYPIQARTVRLEEEYRILEKALFAAKHLYQRDDYVGLNLNDVLESINKEELARRVMRGDDNPFKQIQEKRTKR